MISLQSIDAVALNTFIFVVAVCMYGFFLSWLLLEVFQYLLSFKLNGKFMPEQLVGNLKKFLVCFVFRSFFRYFVALYFTTTFFVCLKLTRFKQWQTFVGRCKVVLKVFSKQMIIHYDCFHPMYSWYFRASAPFFFYFHVSMC